jgi:hypothetical protein
MNNDNNTDWTPLPVKKWDKESLMKVIGDQYIKTFNEIIDSKKFTKKIKLKKLCKAWNLFYNMYEPVLNDRITYKKIEKKKK